MGAARRYGAPCRQERAPSGVRRRLLWNEPAGVTQADLSPQNSFLTTVRGPLTRYQSQYLLSCLNSSLSGHSDSISAPGPSVELSRRALCNPLTLALDVKNKSTAPSPGLLHSHLLTPLGCLVISVFRMCSELMLQLIKLIILPPLRKLVFLPREIYLTECTLPKALV